MSNQGAELSVFTIRGSHLQGHGLENVHNERAPTGFRTSLLLLEDRF